MYQLPNLLKPLFLFCALPVLLAGCGEGSLQSFSLGGSVSGATASGLVLANGSDTVSVPANSSSFTLPGHVIAGLSYTVTVRTQPVGLTCSVASGTGSMPRANVANVVVTCSDEAHALTGTVSGLSASGLVLNNGSDTLTVLSGATSFTLPGLVARTGSYQVEVQHQPTGLNCAVVNGTGTMGTADVTDIAVNCSNQGHQLGGTISGLSASGLVLSNGSDTFPVTSGATSFTMSSLVNYNTAYTLTVQTQPAGQTCSVVNGSGTMGASDVSDVAVTCANNAHAVGGSISGLTTNGLVLSNASDTLPVTANATTFTLPSGVAESGSYAVGVQTQPTGLTCSVTNGSGTMSTADVSNVAVTCSPNAYTLGGTISGLNVTGLVLANGTDTLNVAANATLFTMNDPVAYGAGYAVTVQTQPNWLHCVLTNDSGTMPAATVSDVAVACSQQAMVTTIAGTAGVNGSTDATGPAASFYRPFGIAIDSSGDMFVGDLNNNEIRKITPAGVVTTFAGTTTHGTADGTGAAAGFYGPSGVAIDSSDNLYVVDRLNYLIRKISPAGVVSTLAGSGSYGSANGTGSAASFSSIYGLGVDSAGNVYVGDQSNNQIRKITPAGVVTTFAGSTTPGSADGNGSAASFTSPAGIAVDSQDNVYVADTGNHKIRKITPTGDVTTIAGAGTPGNVDGTGSAAKFNQPYGLAVEPSTGNIYVADTLGNKIRRVTQAGVVTTLVGPVGLATSGHADGNGTAATIYLPTGLAFDANGDIYFCDYNNNTIRKVSH